MFENRKRPWQFLKALWIELKCSNSQNGYGFLCWLRMYLPALLEGPSMARRHIQPAFWQFPERSAWRSGPRDQSDDHRCQGPRNCCSLKPEKNKCSFFNTFNTNNTTSNISEDVVIEEALVWKKRLLSVTVGLQWINWIYINVRIQTASGRWAKCIGFQFIWHIFSKGKVF